MSGTEAAGAELRTKGQTMKYYDAAIAATAMSRRDELLTPITTRSRTDSSGPASRASA